MFDNLNKKIDISFQAIAMAAYLILIVPVLIFFWGWLRWYYAALFSVILLFGYYMVWKQDYKWKTKGMNLPIKTILCIAAAFWVWVMITGSSGVSVSNWDTPWRRAILRDLINYAWPVHYPETGNFLVYYHVFYLVPALVGKVFGWHAALVVHAICIWLIIMVSFFLISSLLMVQETKWLCLVCVMMIGWSGLNVLGWILMQIFGWNAGDFRLGLNESYLDALYNGESFNYHYRSNEDVVSQVYNQLMIWLAVPLMLENRKIHSYAFIGILLLPYSPWGVIGIAFLMLADAVFWAVKFFREGNVRLLLIEIFSVQNLCILASVGIVFGLYFSGTPRLNASGANFGILTIQKFDLPRIVGLLIFWMCEFGIYYLFLWNKNRKDHLFVWMLPMLLLIPVCWAGSIGGRDFCMNASLPALYTLMIYMMVYVKEHVIGCVLTLKNLALLFCLFLAVSTPLMSWGSKIQVMIAEKKIAVTDDHIYTLSDKQLEDGVNANFLTPEDSVWKFKDIAKEVE